MTVKRPVVAVRRDVDTDLLRTDAVTPQKKTVRQVGGITVGQLAKAVFHHITVNGVGKRLLVGHIVAYRRRREITQHAQRKQHFQCIGARCQRGHIDALKVGLLNFRIKFQRIALLNAFLSL